MIQELVGQQGVGGDLLGADLEQGLAKGGRTRDQLELNLWLWCAPNEDEQAAVDAAQPGELVMIEPGTYVEAVDVSTDELTIRGENAISLERYEYPSSLPERIKDDMKRLGARIIEFLGLDDTPGGGLTVVVELSSRSHRSASE